MRNLIKQTPEGQVIIRAPLSLLRTLFGGLLLLAGGFFLIILVGGLFRPGGTQAALANPGNTLGILVMALFFAVAGWFAALYRRTVVIDLPARRVAEVQHLPPFRRMRTHPLDSFDRLAIVIEKFESQEETTYTYSVRLFKPGSAWLLLLNSGSADEAGEVGKLVAERLGIQLVEMSQERWEKVI
jgi:hypothetical protein